MKCLERHDMQIRPVGNGVIVAREIKVIDSPKASAGVIDMPQTDHTVPYGTAPSFTPFPGISCQDFGELSRVATIVKSLRDNKLSAVGRNRLRIALLNPRTTRTRTMPPDERELIPSAVSL